jgi:hypothetical protein
MAKPDECMNMAQKLIAALADVACADYIASDKNELSKADVCLLRECACRAESNLRDVIAALVGHTLAEVE